MLVIKIMYIFAYEIQTRSLDITKNKIMKTINKEFFEGLNPKNLIELQAEVKDLDKQSKETSAKIDLKESYAGIETFDADLVIKDLNKLATFHENLSVKHYKYSEQNLNDSADWWAENADGHYQASKEVRDTMSYIIRTQKQRNNGV